MKPYETIELELDQETIDNIKEIAANMNMTFDEVVSQILEGYISKKITIDDYKNLIEDYAEDGAFLKDFYTIVDDFGKPIVRIRPYSE